MHRLAYAESAEDLAVLGIIPQVADRRVAGTMIDGHGPADGKTPFVPTVIGPTTKPSPHLPSALVRYWHRLMAEANLPSPERVPQFIHIKRYHLVSQITMSTGSQMKLSLSGGLVGLFSFADDSLSRPDLAESRPSLEILR
ncbi:hypothetical protein KM043_003041 [Ampulex compressa]|nr:hypothetical protein KM043_003041 [Ampulex compressa]